MVENLFVHVNEPRGEPALSPDEAQAWRSIEQALRSELPVARIERRAKFRADRAVVVGAVAIIVGGSVALLASLAPLTLALAGTLVAGLGFGTIVCRAFLAARDARRAVAATRSPWPARRGPRAWRRFATRLRHRR